MDELELEEADEDDDDGEEDSEEDHGEQDSTADGSGPGGSGPGGALSMLAAGAAAVEKKLEHKSRVWDVFSPTGFPLAKERVAKMDHKDGKPWEVEVWNMLVDPQPPNDEVNFQSVPRFYEQRNRALMTVVHMGMFKDNELLGIEPHDQMFPTAFYQHKRAAVQRHHPELRRPRLLRRPGLGDAVQRVARLATCTSLLATPNGSSPRSARATTSS